MCAVYVCLTLHVCLQFSVMIIQSASLHPKVGLNVQNCPQACKTWTADTYTSAHGHTQPQTTTHTHEAPGSQTQPGSLTFFGEMLDLLYPAAQCQPSNSRPASVPDWTLTSETQQGNSTSIALYI